MECSRDAETARERQTHCTVPVSLVVVITERK